jgi:hypothetical protein
VKVKSYKSPFNKLILDDLKANNINCWIAGGCLRDYFSGRNIVTDCDMFFPNDQEYSKTRQFLLNKGGDIIWESDNGVKFNYKDNTFDLVKFHAKDPMETIKKFDFTVSQFAIDGDKLYYGNSSFDDLKENKLVLNYITNPFSTLKRALSHYGKGFYMDSDEMAKLYTDSYLMSDFNLEAVSPYEAKQIKRSLYNFSGVTDEKVGQIMSKWAYIGVGLGLIGTYAYLGLLKSNKQTLLVGSLFTLGGLSIGSYIGTREVEKLKK